MSRKVKTRPLLPWLSANMDCVDRRFVQIGNSFLLDSRTQNLSAGAKLTYICMALESGGKADFEFTKTAATKYGIATASFRRYVEELVDAGFVNRISGKSSQQPNQYRFTPERWKNGQKIAPPSGNI